eukprot:8546066-Pyramimonas_sp.AAC.1
MRLSLQRSSEHGDGQGDCERAGLWKTVLSLETSSRYEMLTGLLYESCWGRSLEDPQNIPRREIIDASYLLEITTIEKEVFRSRHLPNMSLDGS